MADDVAPTPDAPGPAPEPIPQPTEHAPQVEPVPPVTTTTTSSGLPSNVAAALACFPLIGGIIFYLLEKRDNFVRFYAMQSIIFGVAWLLFNILSGILHAILWSIPAIGGFFGALWTFVAAFVHLALFIIMVIAMIKAFSGVRWDIPYVGPIARKQVGE